ncbi:hypothetical protein Vau01_102800 [Virgisporangium aurantiacum]|uniref:Uncharacterized protein n=1 Tax=Virgisporangium aurantiacum TaxID=175570 RepID=A0A8J3ZEN8_9ACTN|nr:hypothetical protein Vau01_102800 [Virgisporangium aurantiacum]
MVTHAIASEFGPGVDVGAARALIGAGTAQAGWAITREPATIPSAATVPSSPRLGPARRPRDSDTSIIASNPPLRGASFGADAPSPSNVWRGWTFRGKLGNEVRVGLFISPGHLRGHA